MANTQHVQFSDENGDIYYLENQTEDVRDTSGKPLSNGGDLSEASVTFTPDETRKLPQSGGRFKAFLGSIVKYLTDLGAAAYLAVANNDTTTQPGFVGDARVLKQHRDAINQLSSEMLGKAPASDPTLTFQNAGGIGCKVELRKSGGTGSGPYVLSLVRTDSSGKMDYYALVDQDGNRSYAYLAELDEVKNTIDALCSRLGITL